MNQTETGDDFVNELLADFLDESGQLIDRLNESLLVLDESFRTLAEGDAPEVDKPLLNEMFRAAHSLKGLSGMLGLKDINALTHKVENVLEAARQGELPVTRQAVDLIFQSADRLAGLIERLKDPSRPEVDCSEVTVGISRLLQSSGVERSQSSQAEAEASLAAALAAPSATPAAAIAPAPVEAAPVDAAPVEAPAAPPAVEAVADVAAIVDYMQGIEDDDSPSAKYVAIFIDETDLSLDSLTETLLSLEVGAEQAAATEQLLITSHRIKGSAACVGFHRLAKLAHYMEDVVQRLRATGATLRPEVADALLKCADAVRRFVAELKTGVTPRAGHNELIHELLTADRQSTGPSPSSAPPSSTKAQATPAAQPVPVQSVAAPADPTAFSPELLAKIAAAGAGGEGFAARVTFAPNLPLPGLKARLAYEKLAHVGNVFYCDPPNRSLDDLESLVAMTIGLHTNSDAAKVQSALRISGVEGVLLTALVAPTPAETSPAAISPLPAPGTPASIRPQAVAAPVPAAASAARTPNAPADAEQSKPNETVRVDIERLDHLMCLAGQLVINKARFTRIREGLHAATVGKHVHQATATADEIVQRMAEVVRQPSDRPEFDALRGHVRRLAAELDIVRAAVDQFHVVRSTANELSEAVHQLDRVSDGIQKSVMDTRMVPIGPLFGRFRRVIRDITRGNGKDIQLLIHGEKTELDKRMIDELGDPLIHLIRNSADHGIELPADRVAAGKPAQGTVTLDAFHRGNSIVVRISDDGKGLDHQRIRAKAVEKGMLSAADAERLTPQQVYQLIWEPGFSTAEKVTEVSGRGMGMDIVKSKIEDINGTVELDSTPGKGAQFEIRLPLTLAIMPSLLAEIDHDIFALPVESVIEIVSVPLGNLSRVHGMPTAIVRGRVVSVVHLAEVFTWHVAAKRDGARPPEAITLVIVGNEGTELGLAVHKLLGEEDIVIKSIAENYRNVAGIAGASILGDGRVSLILDTVALIEMASRQTVG
jgi:two-component system chemotaxis sensor kinase CheA